MLKNIFLGTTGFSTGLITSGSVFGIIASLGIVPRFAKKTDTEKYVKTYGNSVILGGIFGATTLFINYYLPFGKISLIIFSAAVGIFLGVILVSLVELLDFIPIFMRHSYLVKGINYYLILIGIGKLLGALIEYLLTDFFD